MRISGRLLAAGGSALALAAVIVWALVATDAAAPGQQAVRAAAQLQTSPENAGNPQLQVLSGTPAVVAADTSDDEALIHWRKMRIPSPLMEVSPPFADDHARLREMALDGDTAAALMLSRILDSCEYGYSDRQQFEAAMKMLNETHYLLVPGREEPVLVTDMKVVEGWQKTLATLHHQCEGITDDHKAEAMDWLTMAAESGMPIAMMQMSEKISDYAQGVELDEARWRAGDATALRDLAKRYHRSYMSGEHPQNKTKFYAALYAYTQLARARFPSDSWLGQSVENELNAATREMLPYELTEAITMAEEILRSNANCCFEF